MRITKEIQFDYGHRVPHHNSKCKNAHGHRAVVQATLEGALQPEDGRSDGGMVRDFGDIKRIMMEHVHDVFDHAFIVYSGDSAMLKALELLGENHRTVMIDCVPTAENLAQLIFNMLDKIFESMYGHTAVLTNVRFYETPGSYADVSSRKVS